MPLLTWRQQLFYTLSQTRGWPMKLYFPFMEETFIDQLPIDDNFTVNDDIDGFYDYRDRLCSDLDFYTNMNGKKRIIEGRFILEAQTIIMQTLIYEKQYNLKSLKSIVQDYEKYCMVKENLLFERVWTIPHGVVKSQIVNSDNTIIHSPVDLISFSTLYCSDLTPLQLKKIYNHIDQVDTSLNSRIEYVKLTKDVPARRFFLSTHIIDTLTSSFYGRTVHLKYLLVAVDNLRKEKGYTLETLYARTDKCNVGNPIHKKFLSDTSPYEHLLWCTVSKGHIKSFSHLMHHLPLQEISKINWKSIMLVCVKLVKFDPSKYKELQATMKRKRDILQKIFKSKKLESIHSDLVVGIDHCVKYLTAFKKQIIKVADYFSFFKPAYTTCSRVLMRNELTAWGNHIFCCLDMFEHFNDRIFQFDGNTILNCVIFYSSDLLQFIADRYKAESNEINIKFVQKHVLTADQLIIIQNIFSENITVEDEWPIQFRMIVLLHILNMETKNTNIHIQELISSGYLKHIFDKLFSDLTQIKLFLNSIVDTDVHKDFMNFIMERDKMIEI